jgi:hypothetical protein
MKEPLVLCSGIRVMPDGDIVIRKKEYLDKNCILFLIAILLQSLYLLQQMLLLLIYQMPRLYEHDVIHIVHIIPNRFIFGNCEKSIFQCSRPGYDDHKLPELSLMRITSCISNTAIQEHIRRKITTC